MGMGREALADETGIVGRALGLLQARQQRLRFVRMRAGGIAREIEFEQPTFAPAQRQAPQQVLDVGARRRRRRLRRRADFAEQRPHVGDVGAVGIAIEIDRQQRGIALAAGEAPQQRLRRRIARRFASEVELPRQRRILPRDLRAAGGGNDVAAHRDHHRRNVDARRGDMAEQRAREWAVAAGAVVGDVVGLGGEGDQEIRRVADPRQPRRVQRDVEVFERIVAAGVEEDEVDAVRLRQPLEHAVETNGALVDVVDAAQLRRRPGSGNCGRRPAGRGRRNRTARRRRPPRCGAKSSIACCMPRLVEIDAERHGEAERLQRVGDVARVVGRVGEFWEPSDSRRCR